MLLALGVAISLKSFKAKFLLVKADEAPEKGEFYCLNQIKYTFKSINEKLLLIKLVAEFFDILPTVC